MAGETLAGLLTRGIDGGRLRLLPAATVDQLADAPRRYYVTRRQLWWRGDGATVGLLARGTLEGADVRLSRRLADQLAARGVAGKRLLDFRRLDGFGPSAFAEYSAMYRDGWTPPDEAHAVLSHPGTAATMVVHGSTRTLGPLVPTQVFDEPGAAVAWIGVDLDLELLARLEALHAAVYARPEIVWDAWSLLGEHGEAPAASAVARALALSPRTLHRRLRAAGTSLRELASAMRVVRAQLEMLQRGDSLEAIALDVGFDSARHFGRVFKRTTGVAPALWREQRRAAAPPPAGSEPLAPGEHVARPGVVYWRATDRVHVVMLAGQLRAVACRRFLRRLGRLRSGAHIAIVDVRAVDAVEPEVLQVLRRHRDVLLPAAVEDVVMVAGTSLANVLLTGCGVDLRLPRVTRVTATLAEALAALAVPAGEIAGLEARAALHARAAREGLDDGLAGLRVHLERHLRDATLAAVAGALGLSERSLERHLSRRRTSFRRELNRARAVVAKRLLEDAAAPKLAAIAEQVGCSSAQHFTTWFRSYVGMTPQRWRVRRLSPF